MARGFQPNRIKYKSADRIGCVGYRVGNDGSVWTRWITQGRGKGTKGVYPVLGCRWVKLSPFPNKKTGHLMINVRCNGEMVRRQVHYLILEVFAGPRPPGMECRHLDGDPTNNHPENLCWGTRSENAKDAVRHGTCPLLGQKHTQGTKNNNARLNPTAVRIIRKLVKKGMSQRKIGARFGVSHSAVSCVANGFSWSHVK